MADTAGAIQRGDNPTNEIAREPARPRPGWVYGLVIAALGESDEPLRPQEVIQRAE